MGRIAFRADERLEERIDALTKAMQESPALRNIDVTQSTVVKAALRYGLHFLELDHDSKTFGDTDESQEAWLQEVWTWVTDWMEVLDVKPSRAADE